MGTYGYGFGPTSISTTGSEPVETYTKGNQMTTAQITTDRIRPIFMDADSSDYQPFMTSGGHDYPVVYAEADPSGITCRLYCPWCDRWHLHGLGEGHRCDHCLASDSPFRKTGYVIEIVDNAPLPRVRYKLILPRGRGEDYRSGRIAAEKRAQAERSR